MVEANASDEFIPRTRRRFKKGDFMGAYKDEKRGTWYVSLRYRDWRGESRKKMKRGFATKREALAWEKSFNHRMVGVASMPFEDACELYLEEIVPGLRPGTVQGKRCMFEQRIVPFFKGVSVGDVNALAVMEWGTWLMSLRTKDGKPYSTAYLNTLTLQLSAMFNHMIRCHALATGNPVLVAGAPEGRETEPRSVWTADEYLRFSNMVADRPHLHLAFELLFWCGLRRGEMLALTYEDFDLDKGTVRVTKSLSRIGGRDVVGPPKTRQSYRVVTMPGFLTDEVGDYFSWNEGSNPTDSVLPKVTASTLGKALARGARGAGLRRIRVHDLRHSHASMLIEKGFSVPAIAARLGHSGQEITHRYMHPYSDSDSKIALALDGKL